MWLLQEVIKIDFGVVTVMDENNKINGNVLKFTAIFIAMFVMFLLGCVVFGELFAVIGVFVLCPGVYFLRNYKKANGFARIKERILNKFENERKCQIIVAILMVGCITGIWAVTYEEPIDEAKRLNNTYIIPMENTIKEWEAEICIASSDYVWDSRIIPVMSEERMLRAKFNAVNQLDQLARQLSIENVSEKVSPLKESIWRTNRFAHVLVQETEAIVNNRREGHKPYGKYDKYFAIYKGGIKHIDKEYLTITSELRSKQIENK